MILRSATALAFCFLAVCISASAQLINPFHFAMPDSVELDTSLVMGSFERAGDRGRITAKDGHFQYPNGDRFKFVGTSVQLLSCFPDSTTAVKMAKRFRALGINNVKFMQFDFTGWNAASILAPGSSSTLGLSDVQMQRFDWFTHQLREHGVYYSFVFHSLWIPRELDGVRQRDSTGWGTRVPVFFDKRIQEIHREIMRMLMTHKNQYTNLAYKDDPALLSVIPVDDASLMIYWLFTRDLVRGDVANGNWSVGLEHQALMDSLYHEFLLGRGYINDAHLNTAWSSRASNPTNQIQNGGFEDPFDETSWFLFDNGNLEAQAIFQYSENEKVSG